MKSNKERIEGLVEQIHNHLISKLKVDDNLNLRFIDPIEKEEISAHYAVSHLAASLIILGNKDNRNHNYSKGKQLLAGLLDRWDKEHILPAYHFDFNNFALIICYDNVIEEDLKNKIKETVLKSPDSPHNTVNWLPMRLYVNNRRLEWTGDSKYQNRMRYCEDLIKQATNSDGGIEDRIPKGISFNLQYDISSLATICLIRELIPDYDVNPGLNFLVDKIAPDGDINYQGRGCNQIFAWGPWIYLLSSFGLTDELEKALDYLETRLPNMLKNNNVMLNDWPGSEKYLWWDYHYASVYSSHLLLWLILATRDTNKFSNVFIRHNSKNQDTGLINITNEDFFVSVFEGRNEYLAEYGPSVNLIWTKRDGNIFKGLFAPWRGLFGNKNTFEEVAMMNYFGIFSVENENTNGFIEKIKSNFRKNKRGHISYEKRPIFCPINIKNIDKKLIIEWSLQKAQNAYANFPIMCEIAKMKLIVDNKEYPLYIIGKFRNQYNWLVLKQSKIMRGAIWKVSITL